MADEADPTKGQQQQQAPAGGQQQQQAPEAKPFAVFPDQESFEKRMAREARKQLRDMGIEDPETIKAVLAEHTKLKAEREEEQKKQMSEVERIRAEKLAADQQVAALGPQLEEAAMRAHLYKTFAEHGIKNFDYAFHCVTTKLATMGDDEELDEAAYLEELKKDPMQLAALGIAAPPVPPVVKPTGAVTSPMVGTQPKPPDPNQQPTEKSAVELSDAEWRARKQQLGIG